MSTPTGDTKMDEAISAFLAQKSEIDAMLARLQTLSDEHFQVSPDDVTWADVATLGHYAKLLTEVCDCAFHENEYAA